MTLIRDDDFDGYMLDRIGGTPTVWACTWCRRSGRTTQEINHALRCPIARLTAAQARIETLTAALVAADRLLDYVRPILHEAIGERGRVHGLSFETAVGDACDLIDTRERATLDGASEASSTSQGDAGQGVEGMSLGSMFIRDSLDAGNTIEVPALGISFRKQEGQPARGQGEGDE